MQMTTEKTFEVTKLRLFLNPVTKGQMLYNFTYMWYLE